MSFSRQTHFPFRSSPKIGPREVTNLWMNHPPGRISSPDDENFVADYQYYETKNKNKQYYVLHGTV